MPSGEPVRVTIFNHQYSLVATEEPGRIEELAHRVDDLMSNIASHGGNIDATRAAVLACLHLADQVDALEHRFSALKTDVEDRVKKFNVLLDEAIGPENKAAQG